MARAHPLKDCSSVPNTKIFPFMKSTYFKCHQGKRAAAKANKLTNAKLTCSSPIAQETVQIGGTLEEHAESIRVGKSKQHGLRPQGCGAETRNARSNPGARYLADAGDSRLRCDDYCALAYAPRNAIPNRFRQPFLASCLSR